MGFSLRRGRPLTGSARRVKFTPTVAPETLEGITTIMKQTGEVTRGDVLDRLVALELKRLRRRH
jgi:hypothetical protein